MKKITVLVVALLVCMSGFAEEKNWNFLGAGFWYGIPSTVNTDVYGLKLGLPVSSGSGKVAGLEFALFCSATDNIEGLQFSLCGYNQVKSLDGVQFGIVNVGLEKTKGVQIGVVNYAEKRGWMIGVVNVGDNCPLQLGVLCVNKNGMLPYMILFNVSKNMYKK